MDGVMMMGGAMGGEEDTLDMVRRSPAIHVDLISGLYRRSFKDVLSFLGTCI